MVKCIALLAAALVSGSTTAFSTSSRINLPSVESSTTALHASTTSRRNLFTKTGSSLIAASIPFLSSTNPAYAESTPPTPEELERIKVGYDNIKYLLENWDKETTVCRENGGECKRDADATRRYLGLRSTTDPLFKIEKVFAKVRFMDDLDPDKLDDFFQATEDW